MGFGLLITASRPTVRSAVSARAQKIGQNLIHSVCAKMVASCASVVRRIDRVFNMEKHKHVMSSFYMSMSL